MFEYLNHFLNNAKFLAGNLQYLTPCLEVSSISDINVGDLKNSGIEAVIFDVDNTITYTFRNEIDHSLKQSFELFQNEFATCIISNTSYRRKKLLEKYFGVKVVNSPVKKPYQKPFKEALEILGTDASKTAMIGDRLLTDVLGANLAGLYSIKVRAVNPLSDPPHLLAARALEQAVSKAYRRMHAPTKP